MMGNVNGVLRVESGTRLLVQPIRLRERFLGPPLRKGEMGKGV